MTCRIPANIKDLKSNYKGVKLIVMKVPDAKFSYTISIGEKLPMFTYVPQSVEIYHRLILRATLSKSIDDFTLKLSQC